LTDQVRLTRRQVLATSGALGAAGALSSFGWKGWGGAESAAAASSLLPPPDASGIDHIVVVMMENRSFDHFFGWLPGSDGKQAGLSYLDRQGKRQFTHHLTEFSSCEFSDPDHSYHGGRTELNGGKCDGWLRAGDNDIFCIGYYQKPDLPFLGNAATSWTVCDRYFAAVMAPTYPNRFYQHAAQTDRLTDTKTISKLPTIWDRLADAGVSARYYFSDVPFIAFFGLKHLSIARGIKTFLSDAAAGQLPAVSFVDPGFISEDNGTSTDDHPRADIRAGEQFLNKIYTAVTTSPNWGKTMLVINFDEWGGFFEHVVPRRAPDVSPVTALRGFRVPALVISPRARRGYVAHRTYDHTSVLKAIEWRWGLPPLTPRDAAARNLAEVLDFTSLPNLTAPTFTVPSFTPTPCSASSTAEDQQKWQDLLALAQAQGWPLPA
jgi:phospholipase C